MCAVIERLRAVALILAAGMGLSACANNPTPYTAASPGILGSQRALRSETSRFNETVASPAVIGAFSGALIGGLLCDKNREARVGGGAAAGASIGGGAGYLVAVQNRKFANREEELQARTRAF